ncbi:MAG: hypothetical protein JRN40_02210 [Nitrososphaerota archaeon]|jgi:hypothetical protein|nr:hypothetical protein [Nitrososphaerota archaeon]
MHYPNEIETYGHNAGGRLAEIVIRIGNEKGEGSTRQVQLAVSDYGVNVVRGFSTEPWQWNEPTLKFFQDTSDVEEGLSRFKKSLQPMEIIGFIDAIAAEDGFMVGRQHFPARRAGREGLAATVKALN